MGETNDPLARLRAARDLGPDVHRRAHHDWDLLPRHQDGQSHERDAGHGDDDRRDGGASGCLDWGRDGVSGREDGEGSLGLDV